MPADSALVVAGEASGDRHAAALASRLAQEMPLQWFGIGGDGLQAAGVELVAHAREVSVLGIVEVARHLPRLYGIYRRLLAEIDRRRPRFALLVDFPDFNLRLARQLRRRGIPVIYFIAPQVWAWRRSRLRQLRQTVRKLLCIFPFEEAFFRAAGIDAAYVGHPLLELAKPTLSREQFLAQHSLRFDRRVVCLLPGSRQQEIERHLPTLLEAAAQLAGNRTLEFVLVRAGTVDPLRLDPYLRAARMPVAVVADNPYNALACSELAVVASGTATVEAALLGTPMVVVYRVAAASWWVGKLLVRTPHYSMVNLLAGDRLVPELIQSEFTPARVAAAAGRLLDDAEARRRIQEGLRHVRERLGPPGAIERACRAVQEAIRA